MDHQKLASTLLELTGNLIARTKKEQTSINDLRESIAQSVMKDPEFPFEHLLFQSERIDTLNSSPIEENQLFREMTSIVKKASQRKPQKEDLKYQVFRRTTPTINAQLPGSQPTWGAGAKIAFSVGPFRGTTGLNYWFDFYLIIKTISVYINNEPLPSLLVPLRISLFSNSQTSYSIKGGSIWIRSNLLTSGAPAGHYTGLEVSGGSMNLNKSGNLAGNRLDLSANASILLKLDLVQQDKPTPSNGKYGKDARDSNIELPKYAEVKISLNNGALNELEQSNWNLYKDARTFNLAKNQPATYSDLLKKVLIPCITEPTDINIPSKTLASPFITLEGKGQALQAAWTLPTAFINLSSPPAAAGNGGLAVLFDTKMDFSWAGLKGGPVQPGHTWFHLEPGIINLTAAKASNVLANQQFDLWKNETSGYPSELRLQFTDAFPLLYYSLSNGYEAVFTQADTKILTDRPVRVDGQPFELEGEDTFFLYHATDSTQSILLYDPNILFDAALDDAGNINNPKAFQSCAIALNNTLLTVTKPISYYLAGQLKDQKQLENGKLILLHGLYYMLPTLPDPYAANLSSFLRAQQSNPTFNRLQTDIFRRILAYLLCTVSWPDETAESKLNAEVGYQFLPLQVSSVNRSGFVFGCGQTASVGITDTDDTPNTPTDAPVTLRSVVYPDSDHYNPEKYEGPWREYINQFGRDCYALLDVSTNADLMGISYSAYNKDVLLRMTHQVVNGNNPNNTPPIPYQIEGMDLKASGQFVKAFTVPQISWEPVINLSDIQDKPADPPQGFLGFPNDGGPTQIFNTSVKTVTLAPIPVTNFLIEEFKNGDEVATFTVFTLPFGINAMARINPDNHFPAGGKGSDFELNQPEFETNIKGGIQLKTTGAYNEQQENLNLQGNILQRTNLISSNPNKTSVLSESVTSIVNNEFSAAGQFGFFTNRGVPLERIDFSGYGASMFSHWLNNNAKFAETSQVKFDVMLGRTAHEVIQVRSVIYPCGVYVVRTITLFRVGSGYVYRVDSGWRAETDGEYDFNITVEDADGTTFINDYKPFYAEYTPPDNTIKNLRPYAFYPGVVKRISGVKNIRETTDFPNFNFNTTLKNGEVFMDENGKIRPVKGSGKAGTSLNVTLTPVYYTANVHIDDVKEGATNGSVVSKKMVGYVQITPAGTPIPRAALVQLINERPEIGGEVDCVVDIGKSGQLMRVSRVEVNNSLDSNGFPVFVGAAKGTPLLPGDGSWSLALHHAKTNEVTGIGNDYGVPLIRAGEWKRNAGTGAWSANQAGLDLKLADPADLLNNNPGDVFNYAFLQNTGTQKTLFSLPTFEKGVKKMKSASQHFADAYHLLNSKGVFPNLNDIDALLDFAGENTEVSILKEGYQLIDKATNLKKTLQKTLPPGPWYWVGTENGDEPVKIYLRYSTPDVPNSVLDFDMDSAAKSFVSTMNDTSIVVDLGEMKELFTVRGSFDSKKGSPVAVNAPVLEVGPDLKPIYDVLVILVELSQALDTGSYGDLLKKGLEVAMSNSPETWDYKFSAEKEIPVLRFPPPALDSPTSPLRLEASLVLGAYFNMDLPTSTDVNQLIPSAGAYVEFYAQLSVMCVSIAAATVYAVGQSEVRIYGDLKSGPGIAMRHGFGIELAVGLPVVGTVSLLYMVGIDMDLNANKIQVGAFLLFKGRAELLGGIVTVTIYIEASGSITRTLPASTGGETIMEAQVTFGLEISIFWVIDISFEESWKESRQIG